MGIIKTDIREENNKVREIIGVSLTEQNNCNDYDTFIDLEPIKVSFFKE